MFKKSYLMILALFSLFLNVEAQGISSNSLVWKISKNGSQESSYIVLTTGGVCEVPPSVLDKASGLLGKVKTYYTESAVGNKKYDSMSEQLLLLKKDDNPIRKLLPAKDYLKLKSKMAEGNMEEKVLNRLKPLVIYNLLMKKATPNCNTPNVVQEIFRSYADQYSVTTKEILNIHESFDYLESFGTDYYMSEILQLLNNTSVISSEIVSKAALYQKEDLKGLKSLYDKSAFLSSKFKDESIAKNHIRTISALIDKVKGGALFTLDITNVLDGRNNIFDELKAKGYSVSPVL